MTFAEGRLAMLWITVMQCTDIRENRALREADVFKTQDVTGRRQIHDEKLHYCYLGDKIKEDEVGETQSTYGRKQNCVNFIWKS
jgi:hypothetical protein